MAGLPMLTRRRALALGAAAGLTSLLTRTPGSASAAAPRGFGLDVADAAGGVLRAPRRFDLVGARGGGAGLEVRTRRTGGPWSAWVPLGSGHEHRPDTGSGEHAGDPVWTGGADELELRGAHGPLRLHFVAVGTAARVRSARAAARAHAAQALGAPAIIPRSAWGGDGVVPRADPSYGDVQVAFVHHTVTVNDYAATDSAAIVLGMAKYHRDVNGWNDLGYNFVVDKYGQIFEGRAGGVDQAVIGAQAQGYNSHSTGIANIGTYTAVAQSDAALDAMARLIAWKLPLHGAPVTGETVLISAGGELNRYGSGIPVTLNRICGHRDGDATECPGDVLYGQLPELRRRTALLAPALPAAPGPATLQMAPPAVAAVPYGDALSVFGTLRAADGSALGGQAVAVQKRGTTGWTTVANAMTGGDGTWAASVNWRRAGQVRARAAVGGAAEVVTSAVTIGLVPAITAAAGTRRVRAGSRLTVWGTVHPQGNVRIDVERQTAGGRWVGAGSVTARPRGPQWSGRVALTRPALYRLTARTPVRQAAASAPALYVRAVHGSS